MPPPRGIILEITHVGNAQKVTAIDPVTLTEVVFQAPINAPRAQVEKLAVQKLEYVLGKRG